MTAPPIVKPPSTYADEERHRQQIADALGRTIDDALWKDGRERATGPIRLAEYTESPDTRPPAAEHEGGLIYVTDRKEIQSSDGTQWIGRPLELMGYAVVEYTGADLSAGSWTRIAFNSVVDDPDSIWNGTLNEFDLTVFPNRIAAKATIWGYFENSAPSESDGAIGIGDDGNTPAASTLSIALIAGGVVGASNRTGWAVHTFSSPFFRIDAASSLAGYFFTGASVILDGTTAPAWMALEIYQ